MDKLKILLVASLLFIVACSKTEDKPRTGQAIVDWGGEVTSYEFEDYFYASGGILKLVLKDGSRLRVPKENAVLHLD